MTTDNEKRAKTLQAYDDYRWEAARIQKEAARPFRLLMLIPAALYVGAVLSLLTGGSYKTTTWLGFLGTAACFILLIPMVILTSRQAKKSAAETARSMPGFVEFFSLYRNLYWKRTLTGDKYDRFAALLATPVDRPVWAGQTGTRPWGMTVEEAPRPAGHASPLRAAGPVLRGAEPAQAAGIPPPAEEPAPPPAETPILAAETAPPPEEPPILAAEAAPLPEEAPIIAKEPAPPPAETPILAAESVPPAEEAPVPAEGLIPPPAEALILAAEPTPPPRRDAQAVVDAGRRRGRWHPLLIALLNLTGLGIGYLFLKRPLRWLIHAAVTAGLLVAAWWTNAARYPLPWLIGLGAWLAWMAVDGWLAARRQEWAARRPWLPAAVAVALIGLEVTGLWFYQDLCAREFLLGMIDYQQGSCIAALDRLNLVGNACELTFSPNVPVAEAKCAECSLLRGAADARQAGRFDEAITGYQAYLTVYPGGGLAVHAHDNAAAAYGEWAARLLQEGQFEQAVAKYETILADYPGTPAGGQAAEQAAGAYAGWATQLLHEGQFEQAVAKYETILADYPGTPAGGQAAEQAAGAYAGWAAQLLHEGQFEQAVVKYETILADYPGTPAGGQAAEQAAGAYAGWATQLRQEGRFDQAVAKYEAILAAYPDTAAGAGAPALAAQTHADWAAQQRQAGDYEAAVANYQAITDRYPGAPAAAQAPALAAETYRDWAGGLRGKADYAQAAEKYQIILDRYPGSDLAPEARESLAATLYDWAEAQRAGLDYEPAVEHYRTILSDFSASQVISQAVEGLAQTTYDWAKLLQSRREYGPAMDHYEEILADPRLSAVATSTAGAALDAGLTWTEELSAAQDYDNAAAAGLRTQAVAGPEGSEQANALLAGVYWAWGNHLAAGKSYSGAIGKYDLALNDPTLQPYASGAAEGAAAAYYAWGQSLGVGETALTTYATLRQRFPESTWAPKAAEAAASIYLGRADAKHLAGNYADAVSAYERLIGDYPGTKAAGQAKTSLAQAEATWRSGYADKLLAAIATAQKGADALSGLLNTLSSGTKVSCVLISMTSFGDTELTIPSRFSSLQTAYNNYRSALTSLEEAKKIIVCTGIINWVTDNEINTAKSKTNSAKSKLSQAKKAADAAK